MTDRPILFSAPMIRALLSGTKTQTRRLAWRDCRPHESGVRERLPTVWQKATPGDRLWVRETWTANLDISSAAKGGSHWWYFVKYAADGAVKNWPHGNPSPKLLPKDVPDTYQYEIGHPSIHMPRWASRLTLVVTDVRMQRLQEITDEDSLAEGIVPHENGGYHVPGIEHDNKDFPYLSRTTPREMFAALFDTVRGSGSWLENPEIVALTFEIHKTNIDKMGQAA